MSKAPPIIPFFNGKDFIEKALLSLANELTRADQIIIINDGSTRKEDVIFLKKLIYNFPIPIKLVNKKNLINSKILKAQSKLAHYNYDYS